MRSTLTRRAARDLLGPRQPVARRADRNGRLQTADPRSFPALPDWKWLPGERQFTFGGKESDHGQRIYVQDVAGGDARPLTPEGSRSHYAVSPDQRWLGVPMGADYKTYLFPMTGGDPKLIPGLEPGCLPATWSPDSQFLYCYRMGDVPMHVFRVDVSTGRSIPWKELMPPDPVGISYIADLHFSPT